MKLISLIMIAAVFSSSLMADGSRVAKWKQDIEFIKSNIEDLHIDPFSKVSKEEFNSSLDKIDIAQYTDQQITLEISKSISLLKDGHSFVQGLQPLLETFMQSDLYFPSLPIRFRWVKDGIFISEVNKDYEELLGLQLVSINGVAAEHIALQSAQFFPAENKDGKKYWGARAISIPEVLTHVTGQKTLSFELTNGSENKLVSFNSSDTAAMPAAPFGINVDPKWTRLSSGSNQPIYLQEPETLFQTAKLNDALYIQIKQMNEEKADSLSAEALICNEIKKEHDSAERHLILDLRFNIGGETDYLQSMVKCIAASKYNKLNKLHVIVGERTFSAGQLFSVWLREFTYAKFYGEKTAMQTHFYSNTRPSMSLPNSGLTIFLSTLFWQPTHMHRNEATFLPDTLIGYSIDDLKEGKDPMLETVMKEVRLAQ